jgi:hypothetical protein
MQIEGGVTMTRQKRRKYSRRLKDIPIIYAEHNAKTYCKAVMRNNSKDGMYFETDSPIQSSTDLYIKWQDRRHEILESEPFKAYRARMKWCQQVSEDQPMRFGIGVQYVAKSHLLYGINIDNVNNPCDFCENLVTDRALHLTETGLLLCLPCLHYLESLSPIAEKAVERFLIGNVI